MKLIYSLFIALMLITNLVSARPTIISNNNGNWSNPTTWNPARLPQDGDSIVIASGNTVTFDNSYTLNNVYISIVGTLNYFQNNTLALDNSSTISILSGGMISAPHVTPNELLTIGGVIKYNGKNDVALAGPATANSTTGISPAGFSTTPITLPVNFTSFNAARLDNGAIAISWSTTNEVNNSHFTIEKSTDRSDWTSLATIAPGNDPSANNYSFVDENAAAVQTSYRIQQVDLDGKATYSRIAVVNAAANAQATIIASGKTVTIFPEKLSGSRLTVRLIAINGQVLQQVAFESASSRIDMPVSAANPGIYVVQVTDGQQFSLVKKVML